MVTRYGCRLTTGASRRRCERCAAASPATRRRAHSLPRSSHPAARSDASGRGGQGVGDEDAVAHRAHDSGDGPRMNEQALRAPAVARRANRDRRSTIMEHTSYGRCSTLERTSPARPIPTERRRRSHLTRDSKAQNQPASVPSWPSTCSKQSSQESMSSLSVSSSFSIDSRVGNAPRALVLITTIVIIGQAAGLRSGAAQSPEVRREQLLVRLTEGLMDGSGDADLFIAQELPRENIIASLVAKAEPKARQAALELHEAFDAVGTPFAKFDQFLRSRGFSTELIRVIEDLPESSLSNELRPAMDESAIMDAIDAYRQAKEAVRLLERAVDSAVDPPVGPARPGVADSVRDIDQALSTAAVLADALGADRSTKETIATAQRVTSAISLAVLNPTPVGYVGAAIGLLGAFNRPSGGPGAQSALLTKLDAIAATQEIIIDNQKKLLDDLRAARDERTQNHREVVRLLQGQSVILLTLLSARTGSEEQCLRLGSALSWLHTSRHRTLSIDELDRAVTAQVYEGEVVSTKRVHGCATSHIDWRLSASWTYPPTLHALTQTSPDQIQQLWTAFWAAPNSMLAHAEPLVLESAWDHSALTLAIDDEAFAALADLRHIGAAMRFSKVTCSPSGPTSPLMPRARWGGPVCREALGAPLQLDEVLRRADGTLALAPYLSRLDDQGNWVDDDTSRPVAREAVAAAIILVDHALAQISVFTGPGVADSFASLLSGQAGQDERERWVQIAKADTLFYPELAVNLGRFYVARQMLSVREARPLAAWFAYRNAMAVNDEALIRAALHIDKRIKLGRYVGDGAFTGARWVDRCGRTFFAADGAALPCVEGQPSGDPKTQATWVLGVPIDASTHLTVPLPAADDQRLRYQYPPQLDDLKRARSALHAVHRGFTGNK